jgi:ISXO2-like transposase domain
MALSKMDETYIGGKNTGRGWARKNEDDEIVVGPREREGDMRFFHAANVTSGTLAKYIKHKDRVYVRGDVHTNTVESAFSLLKRGNMGTGHRISAKHLAAYLD